MTVQTEDLLAGFVRLERSLAERFGGFSLFALFARDAVPNRWDLLLAAPWATDSRATVDHVSKAIQAELGVEALLMLSRIVVLSPEAPEVHAFNSAIGIEHGSLVLQHTMLFGLPVRSAILITSRNRDVDTSGEHH